MTPVVTLENITLCYGNHCIFDRLNAEFCPNVAHCIIGPSGSGKSTMLDLISGWLVPSQGSVKVLNKRINCVSRAAFGYVSQDPVFVSRNVYGNFPFDVRSFSEFDLKIYSALGVDRILSRVSKEGGMSSASMLSGGEAQRLHLAREILRKPKLLLLDEVTSSVDSELEENFLKCLPDIVQYSTIIMTAHRSKAIQSADIVWKVSHSNIRKVSEPL